MKILHIIIGLDVGGAELMLKRLVTSQKNTSNCYHSVVSLSDIGVVGEQLIAHDIDVESLGMKSILQLPNVFYRLFRLIRCKRPDVVHTWMYHADLIGGLAARLAGCNKVIWGVRNTDLFSSGGVSKTTEWIMKLCAILSPVVPHTIICVAHRAKITHAEIGYVNSKLIVIHNGFDVEKFKPDFSAGSYLRKSLNLPCDAFIIGSVGRFNEYKDHRNFIYAAAKVAKVNPLVYFLMVGRDIDKNNKQLLRWIEETNYSARFKLMGECNDVNTALAAMNIFCLHSKSEGFPNVLGEAMSVGLPSVATDVGDAAILLGDAGLLVPPQDDIALANALLTLVGLSSEKRALLSNFARSRIIDNYSLKRIVNQYEKIYKKVTNK